MVRLSFALLVALVTTPAAALTVPYTEDFNNNGANWKTAANADVTYVTSGGPNGAGDAYISTLFTTGASTSKVTIFRGNDNFDASNDAFVGNWATGGVSLFSFWIRQNSSIALAVGTRFATTSNTQAWSAEESVLLQPNTWTEVQFNIFDGSPDLQPEGPVSFNDVFGAIGKLQIIAARGALPQGTQITFDLDKVHVPEPGSIVLAAMGALGAFVAMRRRRQVA